MKKFYLLILMALVLCSSLCGCDNGGDDPVDVALVWGPTSNSKVIPVSTEGLSDTLYISCRTYGSVSVIIPQGEAVCVADLSINPPTKEGLSEAKLNALAQEQVRQIKELLATTVATGEEKDVLEAISLAARTLADGEDHAKRLVVMDTGLNTAGLLDFAHGNLLNANPEQILQALQDVKGVPDLTGVDVTWFFLGDTAAPQQELTPAQKAHLQAIWEAILLAGNATSVEFSAALPGTEGYMGLPAVSTVAVSEEKIIFNEPLQLDAQKVSFVGDSDQYIDPALAMEALEPVAMTLKIHPNVKVLLVGTTATGRQESCQKLSEARASAVKETLMSLGVNENQLEVMGLGCEDPWHVPDLTDGRLNENAAQNRKVLVLNAESEEARSLMVR